MKILFIMAVMLSRKTVSTGWARIATTDVRTETTQTISFRYCETENEAYAEAVKYALKEKPGFSVDQVTTLSTDEFCHEDEMRALQEALAHTRGDLDVAIASSNHASAETVTAMTELAETRKALAHVLCHLFGSDKKELVKQYFGPSEIAVMMDNLEIMSLGEIRNIMIPDSATTKQTFHEVDAHVETEGGQAS